MADRKPHLGLVIVGHVDAGKSTMSGRLLHELGEISNAEMEKLKDTAQEMGKESFKFAFVMDRSKDERWRGISIQSSYRELTTKSYQYTMIDGPGHRDFRKNMIRGIAQGDVAVLVVPADKGRYEASIQRGNHRIDINEIPKGESRVQAEICHAMGVEQMIVCINKMDDRSVKWSEERFKEIKAEIGEILTKIGYNTKSIPFIPISAWHGDNLTMHCSQRLSAVTGYIRNIDEEMFKMVPEEMIELCYSYFDASDNMPWYKGFEVECEGQKIRGYTLMDALEKVVMIPERGAGKPFMLPVIRVHKSKDDGDMVRGRVEQGQISTGMNVRFYPTGCTGNISSIEIHHKQVETAHCGDNVGVRISNLPKENMPQTGDVMAIDDVKEDPNPPKAVKEFTALIYVLHPPGKLRCGKMVTDQKTKERVVKGGFTPVFHICTARAQCRMTAINWKMGKSTSNAKVEGVPYIEAGDQAEVVFAPKMPIVVQPFDECKPLGRFVVMDSNSLIMVGTVIEVKGQSYHQ